MRQNVRFRSLATKFSVFTATLVVWMTAVESYSYYADDRQHLAGYLAVNGSLLKALRIDSASVESSL